jgi:hypothetical protein
MTIQNYLMINESTNIVDNVCVWDSDPNTWTPPPNYLMLVQGTTPALIWELNEDNTDWVLKEELGEGQIGFTWDGTKCVTNEPKPPPPVQPVTSGTQEL